MLGKKVRNEMKLFWANEESSNYGAFILMVKKRSNSLYEKHAEIYHHETIMEENVFLLIHPTDIYLGHVFSESGTAAAVKRTVVDHFTMKNINTLLAIDCAGMVINASI